MKKSHLFLIIVAAVMALSSMYSLAAMNQVYKIDYDWYSQYNKSFSREIRDTTRDKWLLEAYPEDAGFYVIKNKDDYRAVCDRYNIKEVSGISDTDFDRYILLFCTLGRVSSPVYRIKVKDMAQRGETVEVMLSTNSPESTETGTALSGTGYIPLDIVRIEKKILGAKGKLNFVFKNQYGKHLHNEYYYIE
ncbi:MAG TPA: hypothetical protein GXX14_01995 [Clostridiaceae bacterium]|nr:hypothetical protein [Clostridiaceae bacterium]